MQTSIKEYKYKNDSWVSDLIDQAKKSLQCNIIAKARPIRFTVDRPLPHVILETEQCSRASLFLT